MIHCPTCGSGLRFDIASQMMVCESCRNRYEPASLKDNIYNDAQTANSFDSYAYICPSCGAEINTTDQNDAVGFCPYCGGASMIFDKLRREWRPEGIIPFTVTKEQCKELYCKEVKKHIFVSSKYRDPAMIEGFRGIYMPYCSFNGVVQGDVKLRAKSPEVHVGNYDYQTVYYDMQGNAQYTISEIISHDVSAAFDDHISERLCPYIPDTEVPFHPAYLSGFYAETGNVDINEYGPIVWNDMLPFICKEMGKHPYIKDAETANNVTLDDYAFENTVPLHIFPSKRKLFPVWFMSYRNGKKITYAAVNGQTGKVAADLPLSPVRILIAALIFSAVIFGALMLAMNFLPTLPASTTLGLCSILGLTGMYCMQHCYIRTIGTALHQSELTTKFPVGSVIWTIGAMFGTVLATTDGTYNQGRFFIGIMVLIIAVPLLFIGYYLPQTSLTAKIKKIQLTDQSMQSNGILIEARKFNKINFLIRSVTYIALMAMIAVMLFVRLKNIEYYLLAGLAGALLFVVALAHILFQSNVAKRRLPQFNKKGAAYDEN